LQRHPTPVAWIQRKARPLKQCKARFRGNAQKKSSENNDKKNTFALLAV